MGRYVRLEQLKFRHPVPFRPLGPTLRYGHTEHDSACPVGMTPVKPERFSDPHRPIPARDERSDLRCLLFHIYLTDAQAQSNNGDVTGEL